MAEVDGKVLDTKSFSHTWSFTIYICTDTLWETEIQENFTLCIVPHSPIGRNKTTAEKCETVIKELQKKMAAMDDRKTQLQRKMAAREDRISYFPFPSPANGQGNTAPDNCVTAIGQLERKVEVMEERIISTLTNPSLTNGRRNSANTAPDNCVTVNEQLQQKLAAMEDRISNLNTQLESHEIY